MARRPGKRDGPEVNFVVKDITFEDFQLRLGFLMLGLSKYCVPPSYSEQKNANFNLLHTNMASQIPTFN